MRRLVVAASLLLGFSTAAAAPPDIRLYAQLPAVSSIQLSPDGKRIAAVISQQGRPAVLVSDLATHAGAVLPTNKWLIDDVGWGNNDRVLVYIALGGRIMAGDRQMGTQRRVVSVSTDGKDFVTLLQENENIALNVSVAEIADLNLEDPNDVFMPMMVRANTARGYRNELYRVDLTTGRDTVAMRGGPDTFDWIMDGHGNVVGRVDQTERPLRDHLMVQKNGEWSDIHTVDVSGDNGIAVAGLTYDGTGFAYQTVVDGDRRALGAYDATTGTPRILYLNSKYDVIGALRDEWTGRIIGATYAADKLEFEYFDPALQKTQKALERAFPGLTVTTVSRSLAGDRTIVRVEGPRMPTSYYLMETATKHATFLQDAYPGLPEDALGEMKAWPYKARDGLNIPAYLTLPPGKPAKNLPMVVMPHGGPDARDVIGFDWWAQFLVSRGYAVLQPNFRGSEGYGKSFTDAGLQQWGLKMQDDITDGVNKAIADGIADPKRVCIVGASYGGYAALAGATLTPDLYACAVAVAGVSDLPEMIRTERRRYGSTSGAVSFWISRIGSPFDDSEQLRATSPARLAAKVKCPILLMHGEKDSTVPIEQSELMADALESAGKPFSFVKLEDDDHYLHLESTRLQLLTEIERFLAANIGN